MSSKKCRSCDGTGWRVLDTVLVHVDACSCDARFRRSAASFRRATAFVFPAYRVPACPPLPARRAAQ